MNRLGIDLGHLTDRRDDGMNAPFVHPSCPGARVYVTREDLSTMIRGGEEFIAEETHVPQNGYGLARVRCGRPVHAWKGCAGSVVYLGLCQSCTTVERDNRADLQDRQGNRKAAAE